MPFLSCTMQWGLVSHALYIRVSAISKEQCGHIQAVFPCREMQRGLPVLVLGPNVGIMPEQQKYQAHMPSPRCAVHWSHELRGLRIRVGSMLEKKCGYLPMTSPRRKMQRS